MKKLTYIIKLIGRLNPLITISILVILMLAIASLIVAHKGNSHLSSDQNPKTNTSAIAKIKSTATSAATAQPSTNPSQPSQSSTKSTSHVAASVLPTPTPPSCSKDSWSLSSSSELNLSGLSANSLHIVNDPIHHYQVYGYSGQQLINELNECTPAVTLTGTFWAYTKYYTNYIFKTSENRQGICSISSYSVGLHFAQVFPQWSASPQDEPGLASYWASYYGSLVNFERGHINIITNYANQLLTGLKHYLASNGCSSYTQTIENYANGVINAGVAADQNYDTSSGHGPQFNFY